MELVVAEWLNTDGKEIKLSELKGKVVLIEVFQMLCPGCVTHSLPQAKRLHSIFRDREKVVVLGLHSVFEHHEAMRKESLHAFLSEFRYDFPVAIDQHKDNDRLPETMKKFDLNGTPSLIIIDKKGELREIVFGAIDDLVLGIKIGKLLAE
ncbi:MAG: TlpA family protein disulfide reductase [Candidatus Nomurabacteria bacterium]|nr:MAG: TlpA family protein disulfide reductase [Candidatus Nomurabacteria bacterium]